MGFYNCDTLAEYLLSLGVEKAYFKMLAENDNSKQQIWLGGSFDTLQNLPFGDIEVFTDCKIPNYKASLDYYWINDDGNYSKAPNAQLILYPKYPEVRLSGFLSSCSTAPTEYLQPKPKEERRHNKEHDGRVLIFGISHDKKIYAYLAPGGSSLAHEIEKTFYAERKTNNVLIDFPLKSDKNFDRAELIFHLQKLASSGWIPGRRNFPDGSTRPYKARNAGGYTMEAEFGIIPNGDSEPDFRGWELKAYSKNVLTLMTPEPNGGVYHHIGAKEFALTYGHDVAGYLKYFTGPFYVNKTHENTGFSLALKGFDPITKKITDAEGGLVLTSQNNQDLAIWSFPSLLKHWCNKHAHACYMKYKISDDKESFLFDPNIKLGSGTDFSKFLSALLNGLVKYDPAVNVKEVNGKQISKARSQFRISEKSLKELYYDFEELNVLESPSV